MTRVSGRQWTSTGDDVDFGQRTFLEAYTIVVHNIAMASWSRTRVLRSCAVAGPSCLPVFARAASTNASKPNDGWELVVGLEIHAQLRTGRKLFSRELQVLCSS